MLSLQYQLMKQGGYEVGELPNIHCRPLEKKTSPTVDMIALKCRECGGEVKDSKVLVNTLVSFADFGGDAGKRGTTQSRVGKAKLHDGKKCVDCGHSFIPQTLF